MRQTRTKRRQSQLHRQVLHHPQHEKNQGNKPRLQNQILFIYLRVDPRYKTGHHASWTKPTTSPGQGFIRRKGRSFARTYTMPEVAGCMPTVWSTVSAYPPLQFRPGSTRMGTTSTSTGCWPRCLRTPGRIMWDRKIMISGK